MRTRNAALDRTRTFLTLVVILHHVVIPFSYFGHTDPSFFIGFDMIVLATDSFLMVMFFFLSGLFVWPGIARKGPWHYLRDRLIRLGIPFAICALTVIPIAYYAPSLRQHPETSFSEFWWKTITVGPWPSGPIWFLWVLLGFDTFACVLYRTWPRIVEPINRFALEGFGRPGKFFIILLIVTAALYIPGLILLGPGSWLQFGPFSVQYSRVLLYATYFFFGACIGAHHFDRGLLAQEGGLAKSGRVWIVVALVPYGLMWVLVYVKREVLGNPEILPDWYEATYGLFFTTFNVAIMFAILAYFLRFNRSGASILDPMQPNAFGMFLVHYPIVLWLQYWLFEHDLPAVAKAFIVFVLSVLLSWGTTILLRKIPGARHVL
jgi:hypothetical protein